MGFSDYRYNIKVKSEASHDGHSGDGILETGCLVRVYDVGTRTQATIYADKNRTAKTNAISRSQFATDKGIEFYSPASSVDISVCYSDGSNVLAKGVTPNTKTIKLSRSSTRKCLVSQYLYNNTGGVEVDSGDDLPYGARVMDCFIEVVTTDATETMDVGILSTETNGDADGFLNDIPLSGSNNTFTMGLAYTTGSNEVYISAAYYGALMGKFVVGTDVDKDEGVDGRTGHIVLGTNGRSISYTPTSSDTAAGFIYTVFDLLF